MKITEKISEQLGISLRTLARFVGTTHSHLSRYHASTRSLPAAVVLKLATLQNTLENLPATVQAQPLQDNISSWTEKIALCKEQCFLLQKKLVATQKLYQQSGAMLQLIQFLETNPQEVSEKEKRWIDEQRYQAEKKQAQNGLSKQKDIEIRMAVLEYEAGLYESEYAKFDDSLHKRTN